MQVLAKRSRPTAIFYVVKVAVGPGSVTAAALLPDLLAALVGCGRPSAPPATVGNPPSPFTASEPGV